MSGLENIKEKIREQTDIVEVVRDYAAVNKRGNKLWSLCPFHDDSKPSLLLNPEWGTYKCFVCESSGDIFSYIQGVEGVDFMDALRIAARRVGLEQELRSSSGQKTDGSYQRIASMHELAAEQYREQLWNTEKGEAVTKYLRERNFTEKAIKDFGIGYAPDSWDFLLKQIQQSDEFKLQEAHECGLLGYSEDQDRYYDQQRNRVMFPIHTPAGVPVAFGGRCLPGDSGPKYLNSPEHARFHKRKILYGMREARKAMYDRGYAFLVEGYTDVIMCHQAGFNQAIGTLGVALTDDHLDFLEGRIEELILVYDGDKAGRMAIKRAGELAAGRKISTSVVLLPEGNDPGDMLATDEGVEKFKALVKDRSDYMDFRLSETVKANDIHSKQGKRQVLTEIIPLINKMPSQLDKEMASRKTAEALNVKQQLILRALDGSNTDSVVEMFSLEEAEPLDLALFQHIARNPELATEAIDQLSRQDLAHAESQEAFDIVKQLITDPEQQFTRGRLMGLVSTETRNFLSGALTATEFSETDTDIAELLKQIKSRTYRRDLKSLKTEMRRLERNGGQEELQRSLMREIMTVKQKLLAQRTPMAS